MERKPPETKSNYIQRTGECRRLFGGVVAGSVIRPVQNRDIGEVAVGGDERPNDDISKIGTTSSRWSL